MGLFHQNCCKSLAGLRLPARLPASLASLSWPGCLPASGHPLLSMAGSLASLLARRRRRRRLFWECEKNLLIGTGDSIQ